MLLRALKRSGWLAAAFLLPLAGCAAQRIDPDPAHWHTLGFTYGQCVVTYRVPPGAGSWHPPKTDVPVGEVRRVLSLMFGDEQYILSIHTSKIVPPLPATGLAPEALARHIDQSDRNKSPYPQSPTIYPPFRPMRFAQQWGALYENDFGPAEKHFRQVYSIPLTPDMMVMVEASYFGKVYKNKSQLAERRAITRTFVEAIRVGRRQAPAAGGAAG